VYARVEFLQRLLDPPVDRELVAARVHAELQAVRQAELPHGKPNHGQVLLELPGKLGRAAGVVHALVEAAAELRRDRLGRNALVGKSGQHDQHLHRRLRHIRLIHRHFRDEVAHALGRFDMTVDFSRVGYCHQILRSDGSQLRLADLEGIVDTVEPRRPKQAPVLLNEAVHSARVGRAADEIGDVQREEVARLDERVHVRQPDMVGIDKVRALPATRSDRLVRLPAHVGRLGADDAVLPVRLVPNGRDVQPLLGGLHQSGQLRLTLMAESIPDSKRVFAQIHCCPFFERFPSKRFILSKTAVSAASGPVS